MTASTAHLSPITTESSNVSYGGNEVFFSFLQSLLSNIDRGLLSQENLAESVRRWGSDLLQRRGAANTLEENLERLAEVLSILGLVRVFEPHRQEGKHIEVAVLRCMFSRYINIPRVREHQATYPLLSWLVEGYLNAAQTPCIVVENREAMQRNDEYILILDGEVH